LVCRIHGVLPHGAAKPIASSLPAKFTNAWVSADYTERFEWVYELYDEQTFPRGLLVRWMLQNGTRLQAATLGAVALLPTAVGSALGTILEDGAMFLAPNNTVVKAPLPSGVGHYFWMNQ
jgi:hypothetical protein